jgi:hypothetical protein
MKNIPALRYESAMNTLSRELALSPTLSTFVRALIVVSQGQTSFEISHLEFGKTYQPNGKTEKAYKQAVRDHNKVLANWQRTNKLNLVRTKKGGRTKSANGKIVYTKTIYEFVMLAPFLTVLHSASGDFEEEIRKVVSELKEKYTPVEQERKPHAKWRAEKVKKEIVGKLSAIYRLADEDETLDPEKYCNLILRQAKKRIEALQADFVQKRNVAKLLREFETLVSGD